MKSISSKPNVLQRWWLVLLVMLASVAVAAWLTARQEPLFQAFSSLVVVPNTSLKDPQPYSPKPGDTGATNRCRNAFRHP